MTEKEMYEYQEQELIIRWAEDNSKNHPELELLEGSMNGMKLTPFIVNKMKKQGALKKGRPDLHLPVACGGYASLFIELKREFSNKASKHQEKYMRALLKCGNYCCVCRGREAVKKVIMAYLAGDIVREVY